MKRIIALVISFIITNASLALTNSVSIPTKGTGSQLSASEFNQLPAAINDNNARIAVIEAISGLVKCDGAGTCTAAVDGTDYNTGTYELNALTNGATGDGSTDDTTALQAAIDGMNSGETLVLPYTGNAYKITSALQIPTSTGITIRGESALVEIRQYTSDEPVIEFVGDLYTNTWTIENLLLSWDTQQSDSDTQSYGIAFNTTPTTGVAYHGIIRNVTIEKGFRGIGINATSGQVPAWGILGERIWIRNCVGAGLYFDSPTAIGMPQQQWDEVYIAYPDVVQSETAIILTAVGAVFNSLAVEITTKKIASFVTSTVILNNPHFEHVTFTENNSGMIEFSLSNGVINGGDISASSLGTGINVAGDAFIFYVSGNDNYGRLNINGFSEYEVPEVSGNLWLAYAHTGSNVVLQNCNVTNASLSLSGGGNVIIFSPDNID